MGRTKRLLEEQANRIQEEIIDYLEACPHDISTIYELENIDQLSWNLAYDKYIGAMEDKADFERDERMLDDL